MNNPDQSSETRSVTPSVQCTERKTFDPEEESNRRLVEKEKQTRSES